MSWIIGAISSVFGGGSSLRVWAILAGVVALSGVGLYIKWQSQRVEALAEQVQDARQSAAAARAQSDTLKNDLDAQRAAYAEERASFERTLAERARREEERRTRASELVRTVTVERESDPELDQCLAYQLPPNILQQLPN